MRLLQDLEAEHAIIESVVGSLLTFAARGSAGAASVADAGGYLGFFRLYAGRYHHAREDDVLFPALVRETGVPDDRGPIAVLLADHRAMEKLHTPRGEALVCERVPPAAGDTRLSLSARAACVPSRFTPGSQLPLGPADGHRHPGHQLTG